MSAEKLRWLAVAAGLLVAFSFALTGYSFYANHRNSCDARDVTLNVLRDILVTAQTQTEASRTYTRAEKLRSDAFFSHTLSEIQKAEC